MKPDGTTVTYTIDVEEEIIEVGALAIAGSPHVAYSSPHCNENKVRAGFETVIISLRGKIKLLTPKHYSKESSSF